MSRQDKKLSKWRLMGAGAFSVTLRRVFVITLTAVSLAVWTVTVIGMGVLRQGSGLGGAIKAAEAAGPLMSSETTKAAIEWVTHHETPAVEEVQAADPVDRARWAPPSRNPFAPDDGQYPSRVKSTTAGQKDDEADTRGRLDLNCLVPLRLEGTLALGKQRVAIVYGNSFDLEGQTMLLMSKDSSSKPGNKDKTIIAKDVVSHFRVGDKIEVYPATISGGQVRVGEKSLTVDVREITRSSVTQPSGIAKHISRMTLSLGKQTHVLEMKK